jgi:hypothetical protein
MMDERLQVFAWLAAGGGFFGVLGSLFGAVSGFLYWKSGKASGTAFGLMIARSFERVSETGLSRGTVGAIVGAADGLLFLGTLGTVAGGCVAYGGWGDARLVWPVFWASLFLVAGAMSFGLLAYGIARGGVRALGAPLTGGLFGAFAGIYVAGIPGLLVGECVGLLAGAAFSSLRKRNSSRSDAPDE